MPLELHVSHLGSDQTGDGSLSAPYRTGNWALRPPSAGGPPYVGGCTLNFACGGTYPAVQLNRSGASSLDPFTVRSYGSGPKPILHGLSTGGSAPQNFLRIQDLSFSFLDPLTVIGISWRCTGSHSIIENCDIVGFPSALTAQSWNDATTNCYTNLTIFNNLFRDCARVGIYHQGQKDLSISRNVFRNIGTDLLHQGVYSNADNTSYTIRDNIFDMVSNCAIQCRSGDMDVTNNIVLRSGYGIATGHGMASRGGTGRISYNLVTLSKDRPNDNAPLTCGIGACMVERNSLGMPFLIQGNIITDSMGEGTLGGISLGNDNANPYTNNQDVTTPYCGECVVEGNFVRRWKTALRLVERNYPALGITGNTFDGNQESLRMVNSLKWKNQYGVRHFADPLSVSSILQQNTWGSGTQVLEEGGLGGLLTFPPEWLPAFDPGHTKEQSSNLPDPSLFRYMYLTVPSTPENVQDAANSFMDLACARDPRAWAYLPWARGIAGL